MTVKVVTDSTADLPPSLANALRITIAPPSTSTLAPRCTGMAWKSFQMSSSRD